MKKTILFITLSWMLNVGLAQQWSGSSTTSGNIYRDGNVGIGVTSPSALLETGDGNIYFNADDSDNAGFRVLFDKTTNNNGADVDLTINTNSGSPIVDWYVRNWGGSYTFNKGSSNGKTELFKISTYGDIIVPGGTITGKNSEYISLGDTDNEISFYSSGISRFQIAEGFFKLNEGNLHLNTSDPDNAGLRILFDKESNNNGADVDLTINTNSGSPIVDWYVKNWGGSYTFSRGSSNGKRDLFRIDTYGNIIVPQGNAIIDGKVNCEEVKVEVMDVPDYVFSSDYTLHSLEETKTYISENQHLPEVPSAKEMEANGIELGEMNMLLLKKIEELTLHLIKESEENKKQAEQITMLQKELYQLKSSK